MHFLTAVGRPFTNQYNTIIGGASITSSVAPFQIVNNATFGTASATHQLFLQLEWNRGTFVNNGTLLANGGTLTIGAATFNAGSLQSINGTLSIGNAGTCIIDTGLNTGTIGSVVLNGRLVVKGRLATPQMTGSGTALMSGSMSIGRLDIGMLSGNGWGTLYSLDASRVKTLSLTGGGLSLLSSPFVVDYTGATPAASIRSQLQSKFLRSGVSVGGSALTVGYVEASQVGSTSFGSLAVDSTSLLLKSTYAGDSNLDGAVSSSDFNALIASFGTTTNAFWWQGDFNYDGKVNTLDFNLLAGNFGKALPAPTLGTLIPEPTGLVASATMLVFSRRTRHRQLAGTSASSPRSEAA